MKIGKRMSKGAHSILVGFLLFVGSCTQENIDYSATDSTNVESETASDAFFADSEDLSTVTVSSDKATAGGRIAQGARVIVVDDPRLSCATITLVADDNSTLLVPKGVITVDFGTGCTDNQGDIRKGKITITYNGRRFLSGSSVVTTLDGYEINGIKLEGIRTVANASTSSQAGPIFTTTMLGGLITWPDGKMVSRDESCTWEWKLGTAAIDNQWFVTGSATGKNRDGVDYTMTITNKLVYKRKCAVNKKILVAVEGTKELIVDNKKITIDYGAGACDRLVTITIKSKSKVVELKDNN